MAHSYKKRLDLKNQLYAEAKLRMESLEAKINQQSNTIHELEQDEQLNARIVEYTLAGYVHDKKR